MKNGPQLHPSSRPFFVATLLRFSPRPVCTKTPKVFLNSVNINVLTKLYTAREPVSRVAPILDEDAAGADALAVNLP
jgi:hypothetical protein